MSFFRDEFVAQFPATRVRFGAGVRLDVASEVSQLGCRHALVLTTAEQAHLAEQFVDLCGELAVGTFAGARMHTPVDVTETATALARELGADCLLAVGGGSTTGLAKAIALRTDLPQIILPTTYAGSEATAILGQTDNGTKTTLTDVKVQPEVILYDPQLVCSLPIAITVASALNAMAHAAEGLYAKNRTPLSSLMALEGMRAFRDALPLVLADPGDLKARGETLYGAWLCGTVLGQVGMALHHKLCHTLGGSFNLPHAETHAVILPHAIGYNASAAYRELLPLSDLFGEEHPGRALHGFARTVDAPQSLKEFGLEESDLDRAADLATQNPYWNPEPIERDAIRQLLQAAWNGEPPALS